MTDEPLDELGLFEEVLNIFRKHLKEFFPDNPEKIEQWIMTPNPLLGDVSPYHMARIGRSHKVMKFIMAAKEGY